ncbi:AAC(3) family N-acetyltransferase [Bradyrhizobium pachyrhizi]|uniref:aminoglycoside N(3)-acetyltransferase n=1 Tax=Bradyrhizobium pachyrhizi TaxID=280333 RepID=UPI0024B1571B|nr:AAC(3) family N-acetyltransferase [Bradyrhizobium pachyrhizi]WFU53626.1 AAC(3) family N-acetyltransferase [Bradyrhizobium pachyrhizi]
MTEAGVTPQALILGLRGLGVHEATTVIVHASLSAFGHIRGGADTLCAMIREVGGNRCTIVMPGFTPQLIHPSVRVAAPLTQKKQAELAEEIPVFDKAATPVGRKIGATAETFRKLRDTIRSSHPYTSFLANGPAAVEIARHQPLAYRLSAAGPLGALYDRDALIVLLGVSWQQCTALHLAEYTSAYRGRRFGKWPVPQPRPAGHEWIDVDDLLLWEGDFPAIGRYIAETPAMHMARRLIGNANCTAVKMRPAVDFASHWLAANRDLSAFGTPSGWKDLQFR